MYPEFWPVRVETEGTCISPVRWGATVQQSTEARIPRHQQSSSALLHRGKYPTSSYPILTRAPGAPPKYE